MATDIRIKKEDNTWASLVGPPGPQGNVGPQGAPGETGSTLLASNVLSSNQTLITFDNIVQTYNHLEMVLFSRATSAANESLVQVRFNSDAVAANYSQERLDGQGATVSALAYTDTGVDIVGYGGNTTAGCFGLARLFIARYTATGIQKSYNADMGAWGASGQWFRSMTGRWAGTTAITKIEIAIATGYTSIAAGSAFYLYGRM